MKQSDGEEEETHENQMSSHDVHVNRCDGFFTPKRQGQASKEKNENGETETNHEDVELRVDEPSLLCLA